TRTLLKRLALSIATAHARARASAWDPAMRGPTSLTRLCTMSKPLLSPRAVSRKRSTVRCTSPESGATAGAGAGCALGAGAGGVCAAAPVANAAKARTRPRMENAPSLSLQSGVFGAACKLDAINPRGNRLCCHSNRALGEKAGMQLHLSPTLDPAP